MTTNAVFNWLFGPHVLGLLYLVIGVIQYRFPPKKINNWYGYRTSTSQRNQETWDEANRFSARYMIKMGGIVIIIGFIATAIFNNLVMPLKLKEALVIFVFMLGGMLPAILMIVATERHLTKLFGN
ncbi:MAG: SdpI family protein [Mucilaginibacter sp.]